MTNHMPQPDTPVRESVLVDPHGQIVRTITRELPSITCTGTAGVRAAGENNERMALFFASDDSGGFFVAPFSQVPALPVTGIGGTTAPTVIHIAAYPGLIFGEWYVLGPLGQIVRVFETDIQR